MKPEQLEIDRLRRKMTNLKADGDILKKAAAYFARDRGARHWFKRIADRMKFADLAGDVDV